MSEVSDMGGVLGVQWSDFNIINQDTNMHSDTITYASDEYNLIQYHDRKGPT